MSPHLLWVESRNKIETGASADFYCFFGHPSDASGIYAPLMNAAYLIDPEGRRTEVELISGNWLPGYGHIKYWHGHATLPCQGGYEFIAERAQGVYDIGWHGGKSMPFLSYNFATASISVGGGPMLSNKSPLPICLESEHDLSKCCSGKPVNFKVCFKGQPAKAVYNASYWTWDESGHAGIQKGETSDDGLFSITPQKKGLWMIDAACSVPESGQWKATYDLGDFFKTGDILNYDTTRFKITLSLWVV